MASDPIRRSCFKCPKGARNISGAGCQRWMCKQHFNEHQQELAQDMDHLCQEHDNLRQDLTKADDSGAPFFFEIDRWERRSIEKIRQVAEETRTQL